MESNNYVEETKKQLRQINDYVVFYTELESCIAFIELIHDEKILLIISISDTIKILPHIEGLSQIDSIFVFNWEKLGHEHLVVKHSKLIGIHNDLDLLCFSIEEQIDFLERHLQTFSFFDQDEYLTKDLSKQTADLLWFQLYHDILFELIHDEEAKQEMIDACRSYYRDNIKELNTIKKFENKYRSEEALRWYLKKSFLSKIINKALKIKDFDQLYTFRYFMKDLTECLVREHQKLIQSGKEKLIVYRGMKLPRDQIEKLKESEGQLFSINGIFTTSSLRSTALNQMMTHSKQTNLCSVLLEIQCDMKDLSNNVIIADLCEEEQETLFNSNITFRLESMRMEEEICLIQMTVSNEGQIIKEKYIKDSRRQIKDLSINILFGRLMCDMGLWNQSQHFLERLLNSTNSNNEDLAKIEYSLGDVHQWKGEWKEARKYYDWAHDRIKNIKPLRIQDSVYILFNIGEILYLEGKHGEARDYYERALTILKTNYSSITVDTPSSLNHQLNGVLSRVPSSFLPILSSLGGFFQSCFRWFCAGKILEIIYWFRPKYAANRIELVDKQSSQTQLQEICRHIREVDWLQTREANAEDNLLIATILHSFGQIFDRQERHEQALCYHQQALTMFEKYYRFPHIDIAVSLYYVGAIFKCQKKYDQALDFYQRAMSIYSRYYPNGHVYIALTLSDIGHILYLQGKHDKSLKIFEQVLPMLQKYYPSGHINTVGSLCGIGNVHYGQGKYDKALICHEQVLEILQKYYFSGHDDIIGTLNNIGYIK
ncbi:unnamed protein product, partial [Rotaria sp. Silwood2]